MITQPLLLEVSRGHVPALTEARARLEGLQIEHDRILAEAEAAGMDGELAYADEWRDLCRRLENAQRRVGWLEAQEVERRKS